MQLPLKTSLSETLLKTPSAPNIVAVIPALNEEQSIGLTLRHIPAGVVRAVVVCDNGSSDKTAAVAAECGAIVVAEPERGYGAACLRGVAEAAKHSPDIIVFLDADFSDAPEEIPLLLAPILRGEAELVIGSRSLGARAGMVEPGALLPQARFGNWLATRLMRVIWGGRFTDLGPFRAITRRALERLQMQDRNFGWTVEMQIKALRAGVAYAEIPISYKRRVGVSKITGTIAGTFKAGYKILWTIARYALTRQSSNTGENIKNQEFPSV